MRELAAAGYGKSTMVRVHVEIARILRFRRTTGKVMRNVAISELGAQWPDVAESGEEDTGRGCCRADEFQ
jgi:hypothetical protein